MTRVTIVGCGIVGAAIAYDLSQVPGLQVQVVDRQTPAQAATGAALGVLMGAISTRSKGKNLQMRLSSIRRYDEWMPHLQAVSDRPLRYNRQGILRLCFEGENLDWRRLATVRQTQGWRLELLDLAHLATRCPQLTLTGITGAVYSPDDRQVDPVALVLALVKAATQQGAAFQFGSEVLGVQGQDDRPITLQTTTGAIATDWLILAAGLGSTRLTQALQQPVDIRPVLGQAVQVRLQQPLGRADWQPVITGNDVHLVPLGGGEYWIGATVEFAPSAAIAPVADPIALESVMQQAIALCPALEDAELLRSWSGLRPRPEGRPAPIIELLPGRNVVLATGHYRNGVLLAPATAEAVRQMILG